MNIEILSTEERAQLTQNTIGSVELSDAALTTVTGAFGRHGHREFGCDPWRGGRISGGGSWYGGRFDRYEGGYGCGYEGGYGIGFGIGFDGGCGGCGSCGGC
ncbi:hypothetical protein KDW_47560 [Dictyobacter vulcani]|uniref:Uncharacterized protein n=1 Tax=Dictyobacter vulcani TaxID=2607529 RepID=A0A5J4KMK1_9CHLR|nr:hypothetical protein [Dictyobacter vulcani]GER90594.1 hypothetical protein KDW_47560 [Dictyobacter vulcani]